MVKSKRPLTGIYKVCTKCQKEQDTSLFNFHPRKKDGLDSWCRPCKAKLAKLYYWNNLDSQRKKARDYGRRTVVERNERKSKSPGNYLCMLARRRAKLEGLPFSIVPEDIKVTEFCPVLGIPLEFSYGKYATDNSPTVDKFIPALGYIPENITVISKRANRIKGDASLQELMQIVSWMKTKEQKG